MEGIAREEKAPMTKSNGNLRLHSMMLALGLAALSSGCAVHAGVGYRVYDPYYSDYHVWDQAEIGYYNQWVGETHRPNVEYRKLNRADQSEYWKWRHAQPARH
jgi:hypothetical protein